MAKSYFSISNLLDSSKFNNGNTFKIDLQSIKVDGNEQLTGDYFTEITPAFVDPHAANLWQFGTCTQSGAYPNTTAYASCSIGAIPNSFNPFADAFKVNYDTTVDGLARGEILNTVSGNTYGLEQFGFGFDLLDTPVNDIVGGGSTGATLEGCFYLDVDYTQDFEMIIQVTEKDSLGFVVSDKIHVYNHQVVNCTFDYEVQEFEEQITDNSFGNYGVSSGFGELVDGNNGFMYAAPYNATYILKLDPVNDSATAILGFSSSPRKYNGGKLASNGFIYYVPFNNNDVLKFDPSNDTFTTIGSVSAGTFKYTSAAITPAGIIYAGGINTNNFLKIDTNTDTVTEVAAGSNLGFAVYTSTGYVYFLPQINTGDIKKLDVNTDVITTVGSSPLQSVAVQEISYFAEVNGFLYFGERTSSGAVNNLYKLDLSNDNISTILLPSTISGAYGSLIVRNNLIYIFGYNTKDVIIVNPFDNDNITYLLTTTGGSAADTTQFPCLSLVNNNIFSVPQAGNLVQRNYILEISFDIVQVGTLESKPTSFLSGGLSGWIVPSCQSAPLLSDQPIVTESIGVLAQAQTQTVNIFDPTFIKQCCYFSPVLADPISNDSWKNDYNSSIFKRDFATETIDLVLLKDGGALNGGLDIPLVDNTYGEFGNFGFAGTSNLKSYKIEWQKVLLQQGEGSYQIQGTLGLVTGVEIQTSLVFQLKVYSQERAKGTVRIESSMKGYLKHLDFDYSAFLNGWKDSIRVKGFFGNRQAEYEQENIIYQNRTSRQLRSEMINTYTLQTLHIPSCVTDLIIEYHNFANWLNITDYNPVNHKSDYVEKKVVFDSMEEIEYKSVTSKAPLVCKYKDYLQNYQKDNC